MKNIKKTEEIKFLKNEIKKIFSKELNGLVSYNYKYDKNGFNETIFKNYLKIDVLNYNSAEKFILDSLFLLEKKIFEVKDFRKKIKNQELNFGKKQDYILKNIEEVFLFLKNISNIIQIETQKIKNFNYKIEENKLIKYLKNQEKFEKLFFGEKLSKNKKYSNEIINSFEYFYKENKEKIKENERFFIENLIEKLKEKINIKGLEKEEKQKNNLIFKFCEKNFDYEILKKKIKRDDYIEVFKLVLEIFGIDKDVKIDKKIGSISAGSDGVKIPDLVAYEELEIERIIDLISHEIETHMVTLHNNEKIAFGIRSIGYQKKEEGIASAFGKISSGKEIIDNKSDGKVNSEILVGEIFDGETLMKFLKIKNKLTKSKASAKKRFERLKRTKDFSLAGVNPKEKTYFLGRKEVFERLKNKDNIFKLFIGKNSFKLENEILEIVGIKESKIDLNILKEKGIILPLMIGELLKFKISVKAEKVGDFYKSFLKYFNEKYGELFEKFGVNYEELINVYLDSEKKDKKKKIILKILKIFIK